MGSYKRYRNGPNKWDEIFNKKKIENTLKCIVNHRWTRTSKVILRKKTNSVVITIANSKIYDKIVNLKEYGTGTKTIK